MSRECGPHASTVRAYAIDLDEIGGGDRSGTIEILLAIGGMHGHELSGSDCLLDLVQSARQVGRIVAETDLAVCGENHASTLWGRRGELGPSLSRRRMWVVPTFSTFAACQQPPHREEHGHDNNRQFFTSPEMRCARSPPKANHLANLLLSLRRLDPLVRVTVVDYHNGFGRFGVWSRSYQAYGMGHAVYGTEELVSQVVYLVNQKNANDTDTPVWSWAHGSLLGSPYVRGPEGSLREFCMHHDIRYALVEISTRRKTDGERRKDVVDTLLAVAKETLGPKPTKMLQSWHLVSKSDPTQNHPSV